MRGRNAWQPEKHFPSRHLSSIELEFWAIGWRNAFSLLSLRQCGVHIEKSSQNQGRLLCLKPSRGAISVCFVLPLSRSMSRYQDRGTMDEPHSSRHRCRVIGGGLSSTMPHVGFFLCVGCDVVGWRRDVVRESSVLKSPEGSVPNTKCLDCAIFARHFVEFSELCLFNTCGNVRAVCGKYPCDIHREVCQQP